MTFVWPPKKRSFDVNIVFPVSNMNVIPDLRLKTLYIGDLARTLAIYRVSNIYLFVDPDSTIEDANFIRLILEYLLIPPYLRKKLVPIVPELRFAGLLHPLNIATHNPEGKEPDIGDVREGVITTSWGYTGKAYIGYKEQCRVTASTELRPGTRVLVRITSRRPLRGKVVDPDKLNLYIGYRVLSASSVDELTSVLNKLNGLIILTTKEGMPYSDIKLRRALISEVVKAGGLILLFGSPKYDFNELAEEVLKEINVRFKINFIPCQGVYSVRTIEALAAVLAQLNTDMITFKGERY